MTRPHQERNGKRSNIKQLSTASVSSLGTNGGRGATINNFEGDELGKQAVNIVDQLLKGGNGRRSSNNTKIVKGQPRQMKEQEEEIERAHRRVS